MSGPAPRPDALPPLPPAVRIAVLSTRFHQALVGTLAEAAVATLVAAGVDARRIERIEVPGAWELPLAAGWLAGSGRMDAIVALGCVVRGDTRHYEHVADECARGLMRVQLDHGVPVANGVLAVERIADAEARAGGVAGNKGKEAAEAALAMVSLAVAAAPLPRNAGGRAAISGRAA